MLRLLGVLFFFVVLLLGVSFSSLNSDPVPVNYYLGTLEAPLSVVAVSAFTLGVVCAFIVSAAALMSQRFRINRLQRDVRMRDKEIANMRDLPVS